MDAGALRGSIDELLGGRDVVITAHAVRGVGPLIDAVRSHGAARILVLAGSEGTGEAPEDVASVVVPATVRSMTEEVLALESLADHMTAAHHTALDAWDPDRGAVVLALPLLVAAEIGGRPVVGA
ncbi:MAG TPA: hypothetical protein VF228_23705, partial [Iamia sp.]